MTRSPVPAPGAWLALILLSVIWGYNYVVMKIALRDAGALDFAALRSILGALALFPVLAWRQRTLAPPPGLRGIALFGLLQTTAFLLLIIGAVSLSGAGKTAVLVYTMPFWVLAIAWLLLGERIARRQWPVIALAFAGLALIVAPWQRSGGLAGEGLAVAGGIVWAASVILAKKLHFTRPERLLSVTAWQMLLGSLPLVAAALLIPGPPIQWTGSFLAALAYNVILGNAVAWLLWLYVLAHLPAGVAGLGMLATPVVGVLSAWLQLGERPSPTEAAGMVLVGLALALLSRDNARRRVRISPEMAQE